MNITQIEANIKKLMKSISKETFIYDLLLAYGLPKSSITRLQKGNLNLSKNEGELSWKKKVFFKIEYDYDLHLTITDLQERAKNDQRFLIVTDFKTFLSIDTKTKASLDILFKDLDKHFDFFLPWAGLEKKQSIGDNPADVKAAVNMAKLFDEIKKDNPGNTKDDIHNLNVFLSRLLFCFFAEDTNIFEKGQFTTAINSHTQIDGSDLNSYLDKLFDVLNTPKEKRKKIPAYLDAFPYVNGGLFNEKIFAPKFSRNSRKAILKSGELDWSEINPDIFGSMMQAVVKPEDRGGLGIHYTSVPNIMKVIEPLYLNELYEAYYKAKGKPKKIDELLNRIYNIKIFDPACGSGNFLIISYKELRKLEMKIIKERGAIKYSEIKLSQFYGIEIDDFAHEIAQLSLWLAEHQMNTEFLKEFGQTNPTLPLKQAGNIIHGNACQINWEDVCPKRKVSELYILGNPPYLGSSMRNFEQRKDMDIAFASTSLKYKSLDYVACWFKKASDFIKDSSSKSAFVSTNSVTQGEQVALLWPYIFKQNVEIGFAFKSFKWSNNAKYNAGVSVVIIGLQTNSDKVKSIYYDGLKIECNNINPYLSPNKNIIVEKRTKSISGLPKMIAGNKAVDGGNLILNETEKNRFIADDIQSREYIKKFIGADDFINGSYRYCLWIKENEYINAIKINEIKNRVESTKQFRKKSKDKGAQALAGKAYRFRDFFQSKHVSIIVPHTSSEKREYLPIGYLDSSIILSNSIRVIFDSDPWIFGLLSSKMHNVWIHAVAGRLENRITYSNTVCYNTFPFPQISEQRKQEVAQCVFRILEEREKHTDKTIAQLYDPEKMPNGLFEAHKLNDLTVEKCYRPKPFENDDDRLELLFKLYEQIITQEEKKGTLFEIGRKTQKRKKKYA